MYKRQVLGYTVEGFKGKDNGVEVLLKDNPSLQADMVVLAIGEMCIRDRLFSVFGGISYYNRLIDAQKSVRENIIEPVSYTHLDVYKRQILTHDSPPSGLSNGLRIPRSVLLLT